MQGLRRLLDAIPGMRGIGRSMMKVGGATVIAQAVGLAVIPILSRVFDETAFGTFGLFFNIVTLTGVVSTLGLHEAVLAPHRRADALALLGAGVAANTVMSLVIALVVFGLISGGAFGLGMLPLWSAGLVVPTLWLIGMSMILQIWTVRKQAVNALAAASLAQGIGRAGTQAALGLALGGGWLGLLAGEIVGRALAVGAMGRRSWSDLKLAARMTPRRMVAAVARYRDFPLWRTPSHLANNLAATMPLFLMASVFAPPTVGQFAFMMMLVAAPIGLIFRAVGDVFLGEFGARFRRDPGSARRLLFQMMSVLAAVFVPAGLLLVVIGGPLFAFAFGDNWREAGLMASAYVPVLIGNLVVAPLGGALNVVRRPSYKLIVDIAGIALQAVGFAVARLMDLNAVDTAWMIFGGYGAAYLVYFGLILFAVWRPGRPTPASGAGASGSRL